MALHDLTGLSPETYIGQFYFLCFFLFSRHSVADQIGAAPVTCQRNVPALPSISSSTRTGITAAHCRPQRAPRDSSTLPGGLAGMHTYVHVRIHDRCTDQHAGLHSRMFTRHRRSQRFHHVTRHVVPCSAAYVMSAV